MFKKSINTILLFLYCSAANISDANKQILLDRAVANNDKEAVQLLLKSGIDPDVVTKALANAIMDCKRDMAKIILNSGAELNLNLPVYNYHTVLSCAIISRFDIEYISILIKLGADVNFFGYGGVCPMFFAVQNGDKDLVVLLLNNGYLDLGEAFHSGITRVRDIEILKLLLPVSNQESINAALYCAIVANESKDIIELLLASGANANYKRDSLPVLCWALNQDQLEVARLLINYGADINFTQMPDEYGVSSYSVLLCAACRSHKTDLLKLLLSQPNINTEQLIYDHTSKKSMSVYELANFHGWHEAVKIFDEYYINKLKR
jgi:ankyrin repeat protein